MKISEKMLLMKRYCLKNLNNDIKKYFWSFSYTFVIIYILFHLGWYLGNGGSLSIFFLTNILLVSFFGWVSSLVNFYLVQLEELKCIPTKYCFPSSCKVMNFTNWYQMVLIVLNII